MEVDRSRCARVPAGGSFVFGGYAITLERHGYREQAWFTFSYSPVRDDSGAVYGVMCTLIEVTDKVRALARHKEAEERLALSLEASGEVRCRNGHRLVAIARQHGVVGAGRVACMASIFPPSP